jgi:exodeoxyribonuclease V alpha subunit
LKTIFRQGKNSGIIVAAHDVNNGVDPVSSTNGDFAILPISQQNVLNTVKSMIDHYIDAGYTAEDITVLTPINNGDMGRHTLNKELQNYWNPTGQPIPGTFFRLGDMIIQTKNDYEMNVMNGQIGRIIALPDEEAEEGIFSSETEKPIFIAQFEGMEEVTQMTRSRADKVQLSYALTIHKTQGSQYRAIVVLTPPTYEEFYLRQLIYTGITRASDVCTVLDIRGSMHRYIINEKKLRRTSLLSEMMEFYYLKKEE